MGVLRTDRDKFFDGVGVAPGLLEEGLRVMVPVGTVNAVVNGPASIVALAVCRRPADRDGVWWLDVYMSPTGTPLPQMYPIDQILGIPALGLTMPGVPDEEPEPSPASA